MSETNSVKIVVGVDTRKDVHVAVVAAIAQSWRRHWSEVIPFYACPDEVRRMRSTSALSFRLGWKLSQAFRRKALRVETSRLCPAFV